MLAHLFGIVETIAFVLLWKVDYRRAPHNTSKRATLNDRRTHFLNTAVFVDCGLF